jgi:hypothetical protein
VRPFERNISSHSRDATTAMVGLNACAMVAWCARDSSEGDDKMSVSVGVSWKRDDKDEVEDAAALRSEGRAAANELGGGGEDVIRVSCGHGLASS